MEKILSRLGAFIVWSLVGLVVFAFGTTGVAFFVEGPLTNMQLISIGCAVGVMILLGVFTRPGRWLAMVMWDLSYWFVWWN
ncbi:MAG: hypothetical protein CMK09_12020 [Ponticaulis sp.]|nr:hypothetical protein [Ponticaulis sp.]|tara:strand:- start:40447 stop:40689 length:243 start_codon:yes stop_codon:yes gene_type:complete